MYDTKLDKAFDILWIVVCVLFVIALVFVVFVQKRVDVRSEHEKTRILVCTVLDELGADTTDPRVVDACPLP